jgi:predicted dehydrogenase
MPAAKLVAVCRKNRQLGEEFARKQRIKFYADYRQLIIDPQVQAVAVVTTPNHNLGICEEAAATGKHILMEKPLASNVTQAMGILEAVKAARVKLMVAQTLRYNSVVQEIIKQQKRIGKLHSLCFYQRAEAFSLPWQDNLSVAGGGAILHMGIHLFDLIRYITQIEVQRVYCEAQKIYNKHLEDGFVAIINLKNGIKVVVDCARFTLGRSGRIELVGEKGQLAGDYIQHKLQLISNGRQYDLPLPEPVHTVKQALIAFTHCVLKDKPPPITGLDGLRGMQVAEACYTSLEQGQPVEVAR